MKIARQILCGLVLAGVGVLGCKKQSSSLDPELVRFAQAKRAQARAFVVQQNLRMPPESWQLFAAVLADDFTSATNLFARLERSRIAGTGTPPNLLQQALDWLQLGLEKIGLRKARSPGLQSEAWPPLAETYWAYVGSKTWHKPLREKFVKDILAVVPPGAVYFGGTDAGRFFVTAALKSHAEGKPFFVATQNALADGTYLDYVRSMYSNHLYVPTPNDSQQAFQTYLADAQRRLKSGQLKPGENVQVSNNRVSVSGVAAVMEINALLVKVFFDNNPGREFFIEQSWPLDWTYPHLVPTGPIFKINREPLAQLPPTALEADRKFWSETCERFLGHRITAETPASEICDFAERVLLQRNLAGFHGDADYVRNNEAQKAFAKLRYSTADVYQWRANQAKSPEEQQRMTRAALFAFQQAFALDPRTPEVAQGFAGALRAANRDGDARRVLETCLKFDPLNSGLRAAAEAAK